jgi:NitT/TauT family transport system substrate-binding protein
MWARNSSLWRAIALLSVVSAVLLTACAGQADQGKVNLRLALLPILDGMPIYVAEEQGLFEARGVEVTFIPVSSAAERDQLIQAGQADGMINEVVSTLFYNRDETQIQIVRFARLPTSDYPHFRILAARDSEVESVDDLKGVGIGISEGTVIEYLTDRLLEAEGFSEEDINTVSVPRIDVRLSLLESGELTAAMLPDPLSSLAIQNGARVIVDDTRHPEFSHSVISFRKSVIDDNPEAIKGFLAAVEQAVVAINQDPARWTDLLVDRQLVPPPVLGSYTIPQFPLASVPDRALFEDVQAWTLEKGLTDREIPYADSVNATLLPGPQY